MAGRRGFVYIPATTAETETVYLSASGHQYYRATWAAVSARTTFSTGWVNSNAHSAREECFLAHRPTWPLCAVNRRRALVRSHGRVAPWLAPNAPQTMPHAVPWR